MNFTQTYTAIDQEVLKLQNISYFSKFIEKVLQTGFSGQLGYSNPFGSATASSMKPRA